MNFRTISFLSALPLFLHIQTGSAMTSVTWSEPAPNNGGTRLIQCGGYGTSECPGAKLDRPTEASPSPSSPGASNPAGGSQAPVSDLQQCKIGCAPQCNAFGNADLATQCRESCEAKCDAVYGKK